MSECRGRELTNMLAQPEAHRYASGQPDSPKWAFRRSLVQLSAGAGPEELTQAGSWAPKVGQIIAQYP